MGRPMTRGNGSTPLASSPAPPPVRPSTAPSMSSRLRPASSIAYQHDSACTVRGLRPGCGPATTPSPTMAYFFSPGTVITSRLAAWKNTPAGDPSQIGTPRAPPSSILRFIVWGVVVRWDVVSARCIGGRADDGRSRRPVDDRRTRLTEELEDALEDRVARESRIAADQWSPAGAAGGGQVRAVVQRI